MKIQMMPIALNPAQTPDVIQKESCRGSTPWHTKEKAKKR